MTTKTYTQCLKITRLDSTVFGLTSLDTDIVYDGVTYEAANAYTPTELESATILSVNNADFDGPITIAGLTKADLVAGRFDFASVEIFILDYVAGSLVLAQFDGRLGEIEFTQGAYTCELRSKKQLLQQAIGRIFAFDCDAVLGDSRCGVNLSAITDSSSVSSVTSQSVIVASGLSDTQSDDYYNYGNLTFTSGENNGLSREVKDYDDATGTITLFLPFPYTIDPTDTFEVYPGCDKTLATCRDVHDNVDNHRGFPFISGRDKIINGG